MGGSPEIWHRMSFCDNQWKPYSLIRQELKTEAFYSHGNRHTHTHTHARASTHTHTHTHLYTQIAYFRS